MSFKCDGCHKPQPSGTKPLIHEEVRPKSYTHYDAELETQVQSRGSEPTCMSKLCYSCAGVEPPTVKSAEVAISVLHAQAIAYQFHARSCKGFKTVKHKDHNGDEVKEQIPCKVCNLMVSDFAAFPAQVLSTCLEDLMVRPLKVPFFLVARDSLIDRLTHQGVFTVSPNAKGTIKVFQDFFTRNPKLLPRN